MALGIAAVFLGFTVVIPIVGLILGVTALKREPAGRGMAITGVILNGLVLLVLVVGIGFFVLAIFLGIAADAQQ